MTEKHKLVEEIITFPNSYALFKECLKEGAWDKTKLQYMDLHELKDYLRDIKTFERNKKRLNGEN